MFKSKIQKKQKTKTNAPKNSFNRLHVAKKAGHVLAEITNENKITLSQFTVSENNTYYRPLTIGGFISPSKTQTAETASDLFLSPNKQHVQFPFTVSTPNGTVLTSARQVEISQKETAEEKENTSTTQRTLFFFSPERNPLAENTSAFVNQPDRKKRKAKKIDGEVPLETENPTVEEKKDIQEKVKAPIKGGEEILIKPQKRNRKSAPSQKKVMDNQSAQEALQEYLKLNQSTLSQQKIQLLTTLSNQFSMEWLHCLAFSLCPKDFPPQTKENLGSGPKWINTYMMVLEKLVEYFVKQYPGAISVKPTFSMLNNSDMIDTIDYKVIIKKENGQEIEVSNKIEALALPNRSNWPSTSDAPQVVQVAEALLTEVSPLCKKIIRFR